MFTKRYFLLLTPLTWSRRVEDMTNVFSSDKWSFQVFITTGCHKDSNKTKLSPYSQKQENASHTFLSPANWTGMDQERGRCKEYYVICNMAMFRRLHVGIKVVELVT